MSISRLHLPMREPADVQRHLASPDHYRFPRSGWCVANAWWAAQGAMPALVEQTLATAPALAHAELIEAFLEREVGLGDTGTPSQTDLLALLAVGDRLAVMAVEGKVDESFGKLIGEELVGASQRKIDRIKRLCAVFGISASLPEVASLRYQLLHRTASAIFEAKRYRSRVAIMMVHSFDGSDTGSNDFTAFAEALHFKDACPTFTRGPQPFDGVELYLGWTADRPSNEGFTIVDRRKTDVGMFDDA